MALRQGSYKKTFFDQAKTAAFAKELAPKINADFELLKIKTLTDAEFCARYILHYLKLSQPKLWLGGPHQDINLKNEKIESSEIQLFSTKSLRGIPLAVNRSLTFWHQNKYQLKLFMNVPSPYEVLQMQSKGFRCVTAVIDQDLFHWVKAERDPLSFLIHDLIHADHFYLDIENQKAQIGLYQLLLKTWDAGLLQQEFLNPQFKTEFEYVASDMNSNAIHMLKYLKAIFQHANLQDKMLEILQLWPQAELLQNNFANLNTERENMETRTNLFHYLQTVLTTNKKGATDAHFQTNQRDCAHSTLCLPSHPTAVVGSSNPT